MKQLDRTQQKVVVQESWFGYPELHFSPGQILTSLKFKTNYTFYYGYYVRIFGNLNILLQKSISGTYLFITILLYFLIKGKWDIKNTNN